MYIKATNRNIFARETVLVNNKGYV